MARTEEYFAVWCNPNEIKTAVLRNSDDLTGILNSRTYQDSTMSTGSTNCIYCSNMFSFRPVMCLRRMCVKSPVGCIVIHM